MSGRVIHTLRAALFVVAMATYLTVIWLAMARMEAHGRWACESQIVEMYPDSGRWIQACDWRMYPAWEW